ncbi:MAG: hypothetical protein ACE15E_15870 [Acidobacteriota bacterium]
MPERFACLLLDANVVIETFRMGLWASLVERCELYVPRTVLDEAQYFLDDDQRRCGIDLDPDISSGKVFVVDANLADIHTFIAQFDAGYVEGLDAGETEALTFLFGQESTDWHICSADAIVFRILGNATRTEQGISLEELLSSIGLGRHLKYPFNQVFRRKYSQQGFEEGLQGLGFRRRP